MGSARAQPPDYVGCGVRGGRSVRAAHRLLAAGPGWRWIFLVQVPIGGAIAAAAPRAIPTFRPVRNGRIDVAGAATAASRISQQPQQGPEAEALAAGFRAAFVTSAGLAATGLVIGLVTLRGVRGPTPPPA